ncbi:uracil-DNA glycosylase family protein [Solicola sp. PLA-1-18]|uniref:uracil-DNA glycosylase family protein n=1 Tax=Solicola sp. PLA-1-18 TaxID=3380532 RepID=UPI003B7C1BCD
MTIRNRHAHAHGTLLSEEHAPGSVAARRARRDEPHVASLNALVDQIAADGEHVPLVDPDSGGTDARVLLLGRDPRCSAARGARVASPDTDDLAAHNLSVACEAADLGRARRLHWNVVPWWLEDPGADEAPNGRRSVADETRRAAPHLATLLDHLTGLEHVVLLGRAAEEAWTRATAAEHHPGRDVATTACPHPSPLAWNTTDRATGRPNRELTVAALSAVRGSLTG